MATAADPHDRSLICVSRSSAARPTEVADIHAAAVHPATAVREAARAIRVLVMAAVAEVTHRLALGVVVAVATRRVAVEAMSAVEAVEEDARAAVGVAAEVTPAVVDILVADRAQS